MIKAYTLYIDAFTPETIPMARLAEYMQAFAAMLGHESAVHFGRLDGGSTKLVTRVDHEHVPKVGATLDALARGKGTAEGAKAQEMIDCLLADDNATGFVYEDDDPGTKIIAFPGATRQRPARYGPFKQEGTLDGELISVGGTDVTSHIRLRNGGITYSNIDTDRDTARRLGKHLFDPIRVFGTGSWLREENGAWTLRRFKIRSFETLKTDDLRNVIAELRAVKGNEWAEQDSPLVVLRGLRDEASGPH